MDFHILIVIACVFLASLCSLIFINKIFRRKTFEEIIAEKKALNANLYAQSKAAAKKPKKLQQQKKDLKREKKQRQREQHKDIATEQEDSDSASDAQQSVEDEPIGLSKTHVEFEPDPEILTYNAGATTAAAGAEKENNNSVNGVTQSKQKSKKDKKNGGGAGKPAAGILMNKNEQVAVKQLTEEQQQQTVNHFDVKPPKDVVELKKQEKEKELKQQSQNKNDKKNANKKEKASLNVAAAIEKQPIVAAAIEQPVEVPHIPKELLKQQQQEEKARQGSPKSLNNANNNKTKQQTKKQIKETAATKELVNVLDKLNENDTVGVSLLMNLFRRAELNRSEIQILIDYLLNKQQDTPATHSEWSDDICQKLKRQLEEKEKALAEEQEASIGIQAKLRELRTEINTERVQMNATVKAYLEKFQAKDQEITGLNQEVQTLNEKLSVERQQFQSKLLREKQAGSQDLLAQLQMMQNEMAHKDKCIAELTCIVNASRQAVEESQQRNDIIQSQVQQIRTLEQQRDELEAMQNNYIFELEKSKTLEAESADLKVELRNLQNALESSKVNLSQAHNDLDAFKNELAVLRNNELSEKHNEIIALQMENTALQQQLADFNTKTAEQSKEQTAMQAKLESLEQQLSQKAQHLCDVAAKHIEYLKVDASSKQQQTQQQQELQTLVDNLQADVATKQKQLQQAEQQAAQFTSKEHELLQQLHEQKEKNNDIRMKNWKLIEALQNAETTQNQKKMSFNANANLVQQQQILAATQQKSASNNSNSTLAAADPVVKDQKHIRELFQRLYPDAVKACAATALSASFDQWIEQVLTTHVKQTISKATTTTTTNNNSNSSSSNKSTQSNSSNNHNSHSSNLISSNSRTSNNSDESSSNPSAAITDNNISNAASSVSTADTEKIEELNTQNVKLRIRIDELTKLVTKTSNTLVDIEERAREQDEHWRTVVRQKDELINTLQHSNGEQDI